MTYTQRKKLHITYIGSSPSRGAAITKKLNEPDTSAALKKHVYHQNNAPSAELLVVKGVMGWVD